MRLGDYETVREIARGGMGAVFEARHRTTGAPYAAKLVLAAGDARARERFRREAELLARCDRHPGIVRIHSFGETDSRQLYMILDLVAGESLEAKLEREKTVDPLAAARLVRAVASALGAAHAKGIVHRDVKPSNVLLDAATGEPRLTDFGIAAARDLERLTRTGTFMGTLGYAAPEQAWGRPVTPASDVFSLGCILFRLLSGRPPVEGETPIEHLARLTAPEPIFDVRSLAPRVPAALATLLARALDKDPARRPQDGAAFARELDAFLADPHAAAGRRRPRLVERIALGAALAVLLATLAALVRPGADERVLARERVETLGALAQALAGTDDVAALLAGRAAISVATAASESVAWPTWSATARAAIARAEKPLGLELATRAFEAAPPERREEAALLRARATADAGDLDGALAELAGTRSSEGRMLRADLALLGQRRSVLETLEGDEPLCAAGRAVGALLAGGDIAAGRAKVRGLVGERSDASRLVDELEARHDLADFVARSRTLEGLFFEDKGRLLRMCVRAAGLLQDALAAPRYLAPGADVAAIASAIATIARNPRDFLPGAADAIRPADGLTPQQVARQLAGTGVALAGGDALRALPADLAANELLAEPDPADDALAGEAARRLSRLEACVGKAPRALEPSLRVTVFLGHFYRYLHAGGASTVELLDELERTLPYAGEEAATLDHGSVRARLEGYACELCVRAVGERPGDRAALLSRAAEHLRRARSLNESAVSQRAIELYRAEYELAVESGNAKLGKTPQAFLADDEVPGSHLLAAEAMRHFGDPKEAEAVLATLGGRYGTLNLEGDRIDALSRWFVLDGRIAYWLSQLGADRDAAVARLRELDAFRARYPRLLPWIERELRQALGD